MANLKRLSVLIAESDGDRSQRAVELLNELGVRSVVHVAAARPMLEALRRQAFDVALCAERLAGEDGVLVLREARPAAPATRFFLMSASERQGLRAPEDIETIDVPFSRQTLQEALRRAASPGGGLWCEVPTLSITDVLQMYHQAQRSICVLLSGPIAGRVRMEAGEIVDAQSGGERGMPALSRLLEAETGLLRTEPAALDGPHTISGPFQSVLLEAAQKLDERRRDGKLGGAPVESVSSGVLGTDSPVPHAHPPSPEAFLAPPERGRRGTRIALAALLIGSLGFAGFFLGQEDGSGAPWWARIISAGGSDIRQTTRTLQPGAGGAGHSPAEGSAPSREPSPEAGGAAPGTAREEPAPSSFQLTLTSRPSRATVLEAGRVLGKTPLTLTISAESVASGPREFLLRMPGYFSYKIRQGASDEDVAARAVLWPRTPPDGAPLPDKPAASMPETGPAGGAADVEAASGGAAKRKESGTRPRR